MPSRLQPFCVPRFLKTAGSLSAHVALHTDARPHPEATSGFEKEFAVACS